MQNGKSKPIVFAALVLTLGTVTANAWTQDSSSVNDSPFSRDAGRTANHRSAWLRISAFTDFPLAAGTVSIYDTSGRVIFHEEQATNDRGIYPARLQALPRDFRVTVTCDSYRCDCNEQDAGKGMFLGRFTLSADVRNFDPVYGAVYINPATTLASRLLDSEPQLELSQAQARVKAFLDLPVDASLGAALRDEKYFHAQYFSERAFVREAARHGGVDTFIDGLLDEMLDHPKEEHPFLAGPGTVPPALKFVAQNLASAAFHWAFGEGVGWVMQSAGLTTPGATPESIENLQKGLADLQSSVDELSKQLQALTQQVLAKLTQTQYNQIVVPAVALAAQVNGVESNLAFYAQGCPPLPETPAASTEPVFADFCRDQKVTIVSQLNDIQINHSFETLSAFILDNPVVGFKGMPHLYSQAMGETIRFFRPADSTKIKNMFDYWDAVQTQGANLKVELLHLNGAQNNPGGIAQLKSFLGDQEAEPPTKGTFQNTRDRELKLLFPAVPVGTVVDTKNRRMWATAYPNPAQPQAQPCRSNPPSVSYSKSPILQPLIWNGMSGWRSPSVPEVQALLEGGPNFSPITWLVNQTKAVAPDSPVSPGFPNLRHPYDPDCSRGSTFGWSATATGETWHLNGRSGPIYTVIDFGRGFQIFRSKPPYTRAGLEINWVYLLRPLATGEQYYWYP